MAEEPNIFKLNSNLVDAGNKSNIISGDNGLQMRLSFTPEKDISAPPETNRTCKGLTLQSVQDDLESGQCNTEITGQVSPKAANTGLEAKSVSESEDVSLEHRLNCQQRSVNNSEDKENNAASSITITLDNARDEVDSSGTLGEQQQQQQHDSLEDNDAEVARRAQEEGHVHVVFSGTVTQEGCCRFVSEILKCILYQRQQLPMTYDQLVYSQKKQQDCVQDEDAVSRRPTHSAADAGRRKCQQTLQELEEVLQQLEVLFSLSRVPRVLLLMGGSVVMPKELYEINMEALVTAGGDQCLRVSSCLRQLFRTLFVADLLSDTKPVRLMPTTVLALAHRDSGVDWFRPKLQFKVPKRVKNKIIALSTDPGACKEPARAEDWQDYVWFQAPMTIKGFAN